MDMRTDCEWPEKGKSLSVGDSIEGVYVSKKEDVGVNKSAIYVIRTPTGELVGVWGSTVLNSKMASVNVGQFIAIEFIGMKTPKSGGKPYKDWFVGVDDSASVDETEQELVNELPDPDPVPF